jgi:hypothetical protein
MSEVFGKQRVQLQHVEYNGFSEAPWHGLLARKLLP